MVAWSLPALVAQENAISDQLLPASRLVLAHPHLEQLQTHPLMVGLAVAQIDRDIPVPLLRIASSEPFGVTAESRAWAAPESHDHRRTIILTCFLVGPKMSGSSFGQRAHTALSMFKIVDSFVMNSPGLCTAALHMVHDIPGLGDPFFQNRSVRDSTTYHGFVPRPDYHPYDRRFVLYARVLKRIEWDCAFAVDLTDVVVLAPPRCDALPSKLAIATDGGSPKVTRTRLPINTPSRDRPAPAHSDVKRLLDTTARSTWII